MELVHELENLAHVGRHKMLSMQDISNWQGHPLPAAVKDNEVLAVKASEGNNFHDPYFGDNWKFAEDNEKARIAYHLLHPSVPGLQQAKFFLEFIDIYGIENGDMFALDMELTDGMTPQEVTSCAKEFLDYVAAQTKANPFVYSYIYFIDAGNCETVADRPLWIADPSSPPAKPRVPKPFTDWEIHQYGIFKGIDADVVKAETVNQLAKFGALVGKPDPDPTQVVLTLTDGKAETREDLPETTTLNELRGKTLTAGEAKLEFS